MITSGQPVIKTIETELAAALVTIEALRAIKTPGQMDSALQAAVQRLGAAEVDHLAQIQALTAENAALKAINLDFDAKVETRAGMKAADIAGAVGIPAFAMERGEGGTHISSKGKSPAELLAQYNAIEDPVARGKFFEEHGAQMLKK